MKAWGAAQKESEKLPGSQTASQNNGHSSPDRVYAILRRLNARLSIAEQKVSTLQRDLWRLEKQSSRDKAKITDGPPVEPTPTQVMRFFPGTNIPTGLGGN